jgi:hypothetical protein
MEKEYLLYSPREQNGKRVSSLLSQRAEWKKKVDVFNGKNVNVNVE